MFDCRREFSHGLFEWHDWTCIYRVAYMWNGYYLNNFELLASCIFIVCSSLPDSICVGRCKCGQKIWAFTCVTLAIADFAESIEHVYMMNPRLFVNSLYFRNINQFVAWIIYLFTLIQFIIRCLLPSAFTIFFSSRGSQKSTFFKKTRNCSGDSELIGSGLQDI